MGRGSDLTQAGSVDGGLPITKQSRGLPIGRAQKLVGHSLIDNFI